MMSRIVLIEDNAHSARLAARLLEKAGHTVLIAYEGEAGLALVEAEMPDLVLVDLGLPDVDGQTVIAMLRQSPALNAVPMVAFTAWPEETAHEMAAAYGCDGVILKPIDTRTFAARVSGFLTTRQGAAGQAKG
jgi:two-component system cell cycle response regulator DivK